MTVDLEEEQDPPSFKAARKKDRERLQRVSEQLGCTGEITLDISLKYHIFGGNSHSQPQQGKGDFTDRKCCSFIFGFILFSTTLSQLLGFYVTK
jgi:hypothetical protein